MSNQIKCKALVKWRLDRVIEYIETNLTRPIYLDDLGKVAGVSRMHFAIQFRVATGFSPHQYLLSRKIARGQRLLLDPLTSIVDASILSGFSSQAHFTLIFKKLVGETPGRWRARTQPYPKR
jgi:AraC family transcriptional regulator